MVKDAKEYEEQRSKNKKSSYEETKFDIFDQVLLVGVWDRRYRSILVDPIMGRG